MYKFDTEVMCLKSVVLSMLVFFSVSIPETGAVATEEEMLAVPRAYFGDVTLLNQENRELHFFNDLMRDRVILVTPFFTRCPNVCPMTTHFMIQAQNELGESFGRDVLFLSITTDPEYDTPVVLNKHAELMGTKPGWHFLTGDVASVETILRKFGFVLPSQKEIPPPDQHSTRMFILKAKTGVRVSTGSAKMTAECLVTQLRWAMDDTIETEVVAPQC